MRPGDKLNFSRNGCLWPIQSGRLIWGSMVATDSSLPWGKTKNGKFHSTLGARSPLKVVAASRRPVLTVNVGFAIRILRKYVGCRTEADLCKNERKRVNLVKVGGKFPGGERARI